MIYCYEENIELFGSPIILKASVCDAGIQILLAGGERMHIGAVSISGEDGTVTTRSFPGHKEAEITIKWAGVLYEKLQIPVVVSAGIHYNGITKEQIRMILQGTDQLLSDMIMWIDKLQEQEKIKWN